MLLKVKAASHPNGSSERTSCCSSPIKLEMKFSRFPSSLSFYFPLGASSGLIYIHNICILPWVLMLASWREFRPGEGLMQGTHLTLSVHQTCQQHFSTLWSSRAILAPFHPRVTPSLPIKDLSGWTRTLLNCLRCLWHIAIMLSESPANVRFIYCCSLAFPNGG